MASTKLENIEEGKGISAVAGSAVGTAMEIDYESHESEFRRQFESSSAALSLSWEEISIAYRYGWDHYDRPEYRGKAWSQVDYDLRKCWTGGKWSEYKPHVRSAWERRARLKGQAEG